MMARRGRGPAREERRVPGVRGDLRVRVVYETSAEALATGE
jgi:hypothetical protein